MTSPKPAPTPGPMPTPAMSVMAQPRVRMGEAIRLRLEGWMRPAIRQHAAVLAEAVVHPVSQAAAIRDVVVHVQRPARCRLQAPKARPTSPAARPRNAWAGAKGKSGSSDIAGGDNGSRRRTELRKIAIARPNWLIRTNQHFVTRPS
jgi:hypothetical protein